MDELDWSIVQGIKTGRKRSDLESIDFGML